MHLVITQEGSGSIIGRDGQLSARERNDEFGFCLALESSLNSREDFPPSSTCKGWDFPAPGLVGQLTCLCDGAGAQSLQSSPTLCDPMD